MEKIISTLFITLFTGDIFHTRQHVQVTIKFSKWPETISENLENKNSEKLYKNFYKFFKHFCGFLVINFLNICNFFMMHWKGYVMNSFFIQIFLLSNRIIQILIHIWRGPSDLPIHLIKSFNYIYECLYEKTVHHVFFLLLNNSSRIWYM